jgi:Flp pilus assembly protein TadB
MNEQAQTNQILEFLHIMEASLRSGYDISQSMEIFVKDANMPLTAEVQKVQEDMEAGLSLLDAYDQWLTRQPSHDLDLIVASLHTQLEAGGNLANKFQFISQMLLYLKRVG